MSPGRYTELFFLDEATALAAGHRPCAECRRPDYQQFRAAWARGNARPLPSADELDEVLHDERVGGGGEKRTYPERLSRLPPGVMVVRDDGRAYLLFGEAISPWEPDGYGSPVTAPGDEVVRLLTPPSVVRAVAAGYPVGVHASARSFLPNALTRPSP
jgi:hypothetical protein